jgi:hypothetical protein
MTVVIFAFAMVSELGIARLVDLPAFVHLQIVFVFFAASAVVWQLRQDPPYQSLSAMLLMQCSHGRAVVALPKLATQED